VGTSRSMTDRLPVRAVLFDRDGTLIADVPYNGDPALVRPLPGAVRAVRRLREAGIAVGVVSNQSGIGRGLLTTAQVERVNTRVDELLGPFDEWRCCPHAPEDACSCRKPQPGMVTDICRSLGIRPDETVVIGDIAADVRAAAAAGAASVLVPTEVTRPDEIAAAPCVAATVTEAVELVLRGTVLLRPAPEREVVR